MPFARGRFAQRGRERGAADDHRPARQVLLRCVGRLQEHLQDGRDAVREGDLFGLLQLEQDVGQIASRQDGLEPERDRDVRDAPREHVEHRRDRHVHVLAMDALPRARRAERHRSGHRVQYDLAVAVVHALRIAGRAGRVEGRRLGVLVEVAELEVCRCGADERFVLARDRQRVRRDGLAVGEHHDLAHALQLALHALEQGHEVGVHEHDLRLRVVQGVGDLLRREPDVHGEERRAHHRDREVALEVAVAVPVHDRDGRAVPDAERLERGGELADAAAEIAVGVAELAAVGDLLVAVEARASS